MTEWANYSVTAVRNDSDRIDIVKRSRESEGGLSRPVKLLREAVAQDLEFDGSYCTAIRTEDGSWERGDDRAASELDGEVYIRTEEGNKPADNLEGLPEL